MYRKTLVTVDGITVAPVGSTLKVGVLSKVLSSVLLTPAESLAATRSGGVSGAAGAVLSMTTVTMALGALMLPARSTKA